MIYLLILVFIVTGIALKLVYDNIKTKNELKQPEIDLDDPITITLPEAKIGTTFTIVMGEKTTPIILTPVSKSKLIRGNDKSWLLELDKVGFGGVKVKRIRNRK